jgi:6-pyruvoyltetrahydropterin/6-carboxytetrahydropterin synthase
LHDDERFHAVGDRVPERRDGRFAFIGGIIAEAMELFLKFSINAARRLPKLPPEHVCSRVHGHTFDIEVHIAGAVDPTTGWVIDFAELDGPVAGVKQALEHRYLNEVPGLENPTSENLALWIWQRIDADVPGLSRIVVMEGHDRGCT